jgi:hypothetical protein
MEVLSSTDKGSVLDIGPIQSAVFIQLPIVVRKKLFPSAVTIRVRS